MKKRSNKGERPIAAENSRELHGLRLWAAQVGFAITPEGDRVRLYDSGGLPETNDTIVCQPRETSRYDERPNRGLLTFSIEEAYAFIHGVAHARLYPPPTLSVFRASSRHLPARTGRRSSGEVFS
jgi:hypothetical protein